MRHPSHADELFEIAGNQLRPIFRNDARMFARGGRSVVAALCRYGSGEGDCHAHAFQSSGCVGWHPPAILTV